MTVTCPHCGFENPPGFRFCGMCGANLMLATQAVARRSELPSLPLRPRGVVTDAERRQITVMFCDIVGSTALSRALDPEDLLEVVAGYREGCAAAVRRFGGVIAQLLGDGLLIYFGYPEAHEDDPLRSVKAGLEILDEMGHLNRDLEARGLTSIRVRIGIHTGIVVVGDMTAGETIQVGGIVGDTPNIAARLQELAEPNTIIVSAETLNGANRLGRTVIARSLGRRQIKGVREPLALYEVLAEQDQAGALQEQEAGRTPFVDREQEIALLMDAWRHVSRGKGHALVLSGEAGIGKSRLLYEFRNRLTEEIEPPILVYCSAHHSTSALYPIAETLGRIWRLGQASSPAERLTRLRAALRQAAVPESQLPFFAELFHLPIDDAGDQPLAPAERRQRIFAALGDLLTGRTPAKPRLLIVEDIQWADDSTLGLIQALIGRLAERPMLAILTLRSGTPISYSALTQLPQIHLNRLSYKFAEAMAVRVTTTRLAAHRLRAIVAKTDGVPLFIEELTKTVLATVGDNDEAPSNDNPEDGIVIPDTLRDSLMARLDLLKSAKPTAQIAAVLGRAFDYRLICGVSGRPQAEVARDLRALVDADFLRVQGQPPEAVYVFRHALIQDAAYDSLLRAQRRQHHERTAGYLEAQSLDIRDNQPEILAYHFARAGRASNAIRYWRIAGGKAAQRSANVEAAAHFQSALNLLSRLPDDDHRMELEIDLQMALGAQYLAIKGNGAPEVEQAYDRAARLCERIGDVDRLFRALRGLQTVFMVQGRVRAADDRGQRLLAIAEASGDQVLRLQAHRPLGLNLIYLGDFRGARQHLKAALRLYDPARHGDQRFAYGSDPGVLATCNLAWAEWFLGHPAAAVRLVRSAVEQATVLEHPHSIAFARSFAASIFQFAGDAKRALEEAGAIIALAEKHGFAYWRAWGTVLQAWAEANLGRGLGALQDLSQGLEYYRETGAELMTPYFLTLRAESARSCALIDDALSSLDEALAVTQRLDIRFYMPETLRLKGELLAAERPQHGEEAQACLRSALATAEDQGSAVGALRATVGLCRATSDRPIDEAEALAALQRLCRRLRRWADGPDLGEAATILAMRRRKPKVPGSAA